MSFKIKIIIIPIVIILIIFTYFILQIKNKESDDINNSTGFFPAIIDLLSNSDINIPLINTPQSEPMAKKIYQIPDHISSDFIINSSSSTLDISNSEDSDDIVSNIKNFIVSVDKKTGNLYFYDLLDKEIIRLSNTTISGVSNIYSSYNEEKLYIYIKTTADSGERQSYSYNFNPEAIESRVTNVIKLNPFIDIIGGINNLLYWKNTDTNFIYKGNANLSNTETILTNSKIDWIYKISNTKLFSNQKPSSFKQTSAYMINNDTLEKLISNKNGLNILPSPDGNKIIYNSTSGSYINTFMYNIDSKINTKLPFNTFIEKCTWTKESLSLYCATSSNEDYLSSSIEDWYMGYKQISDKKIISVNIENPSKIINVVDSGLENPDIEKITISDDYKTLVFKNKKDSSLWVINLAY